MYSVNLKKQTASHEAGKTTEECVSLPASFRIKIVLGTTSLLMGTLRA
jgi:hypothetical protein